MRRLAALVLSAAAVVALAGCFDLNRIVVFPVSLVNDTAAPVVVRDCPDFCSSSPLVFDLGPGQGTRINRAQGEHQYFSVTTPAGGHIGCVDLYFPTYSPGGSALISAAGRCPGGSDVPWVPIALIALVAGLPVVVLFTRRPRWR